MAAEPDQRLANRQGQGQRALSRCVFLLLVMLVPDAFGSQESQDDPDLSSENMECTIENVHMWKDCGSCKCCYKRTETRVTCVGNITDVPDDLPRNITHLTLRETDLVMVSAVTIDGIWISKFSIYQQLIQLELKDNKKLGRIDAGAFNFDPLVVPENALKNIYIDGSPNLKHISDEAFGYFHTVSDIKIVYCGIKKPPLWKRDAFMSADIHTVYMIDLSHNKICEIAEGTFDVAQQVKIGTIDLSFNNIRHLKRHSVEGSLEIGTLKLRHNPLHVVDDYAFEGSKINNLILSDNRYLTILGQHAFSDTDLEHLDLSRTSITSLPTSGLRSLKNLTIESTPSLRTFPSVFEMEQIKGARLTYPHHCCAFHHPEKQNKTAYEIFRREMEAECMTSTTAATTAADGRAADGWGAHSLTYRLPRFARYAAELGGRLDPRRSRRGRAVGVDKAFGRFSSEQGANFSLPDGAGAGVSYYDTRRSRTDADGDGFDDIFDGSVRDDPFADVPAPRFDDGGFHMSTLNPHETYLSTKRCGELVEHIKRVSCTPLPDAFNPCEDVLGYTWLRVVAWFVVVTAELGNTAVVVVTLCSKYKLTGLTVSKFLICNLALADLTLGTYLMVLAGFDLASRGRYFTLAIVWQHEGGCQLAGFLATFSTCLSTFTLTVITLERWYTIRYAMNPDKRLRLRHAVVIMTCGWTFSLAMAVLPLFGVSSFSKTSICLPMETGRPVDRGYVVALMLVNLGCFVVICVCYADMYHKVRANNTTSAVGRSDANIAKRMASLVFTDFVCLFPIVFFALTAAAGFPLISVSDSKILLVVFFPLNACANPFLYVIATKHFRNDLVSMLSRCGFCERKASEYRLAMTSNPMSRSQSVGNSLSGLMQNTVHRQSVGSILTQASCLSDNHRAPKPPGYGPSPDRNPDGKRLSVVFEDAKSGTLTVRSISQYATRAVENPAADETRCVGSAADGPITPDARRQLAVGHVADHVADCDGDEDGSIRCGDDGRYLNTYTDHDRCSMSSNAVEGYTNSCYAIEDLKLDNVSHL